jgi:Zn-dependent protease
MAYALGDDTAKRMGRLTLNPFAHLDPIGFLMLLFAHFGWAKPVPFNPYNFHANISQKKATLLVALAGPLMNLGLAITGAVLLKVVLLLPASESLGIIAAMLYSLIWINLTLMVFNLIPVPPLDGSKILAGILPNSAGHFLYSLEQYGFVILLALVMTGATSKILSPCVQTLFALIETIVM